jgi:putative transposase
LVGELPLGWDSRGQLRFMHQRRIATPAAVFRKLLKRSGRVPYRLVTDRFGSYRAAHRVIMPSVVHDTTRCANNLGEVSHQPTRRRERHLRRFKSVAQAQRFLAVHDVVRNLFTVGRHRLRAGHQRLLRSRAFVTWNAVAAA